MIIPSGKRLRLRQGGKSVVGDIPLVIEEDVSLTLSSNFSSLLDGGTGGLAKLLNFGGTLAEAATGGLIKFSSQFKQLGFQQWENTDPIAFTTTIGFYMGSTNKNSGKIEVYEPMIRLASLVLPSEGGKAKTLIAPGPPPEALISDKVSLRTISLEIGKILRIDNIIVKRAEPLFSNESDDEGYPISGKITLDINSLFTATVQMLQNRKFETIEDLNAYSITNGL